MSFLGSMFDPSKGSGFQGQTAQVNRPGQTTTGGVLTPQQQLAQAIQQHGGPVAAALGLAGAGAQAPNPYQLDIVTTPDQAQQAYQNAQQGLSNQQAFVSALQAQGGIGNQSNVFSQQQALANQLGQQAQGAGPNPALAQLAQTTGANVANQAALMAGQRGGASNVGLLARQAGQQGAGIQQQAVGQAATMRAQQQLAAQQALMQQQAQMANLATQQVGQQAGALQGYNAAAQGMQGQVLGNIGQQNQTQASLINGQNAAQAEIAKGNQQNQGALLGGLLSGAASALPLLAEGGMISGYADGGDVTGPKSMVGRFLKGFASGYGSKDLPTTVQKLMAPPKPATMPIQSQVPIAPGVSLGVVPGAVTGKNIFGVSATFKQGGPVVGEKLAAEGMAVPGQAKVKGNSFKNDTVPAMLSPGEVVIPRSVMQSEDPVNNAAKFVQAVMAKQSMGRKR